MFKMEEMPFVSKTEHIISDVVRQGENSEADSLEEEGLKSELLIPDYEPPPDHEIKLEKYDGPEQDVQGTDIEGNTGPSQRHIPITNLVPYVKLERITEDRLNIKVEAESIVEADYSIKKNKCRNSQKEESKKRKIPSPKTPIDPGVVITKLIGGRETHFCQICPYKVQNKQDIIKHLLRHPGVKPYRCSVCASTYKRANYIKSHMLTHTGEKLFVCEICPLRCRTSSVLKKHMLTHTGEMPFVCEICPYRSRTATYLRKHMCTHSGERPHKCKECPDAFSTLSLLKGHVAEHHPKIAETEIHGSNNKRDYCEICKKYFSGSNYLIEHNTRLHADQTIPEEALKCDDCSKEFACKNLLKSHIQSIHLPSISKDSKKFMCDHCGRSFRDKRGLIIHLQSLRNQRYYCNICGKGSASEYGLSDHKRRVHSSQPRRSKPSQLFYCDKCGKHFSDIYKLATHFRIVHVPEYNKNFVPCDECHKQFSCRKYMLKHKKVHYNRRLICADCSAVFSTRLGLICHIQKKHFANSSTVNPQAFKCVVCSKVLSTKYTLHKHLHSKHNISTGTVKFFDCSVCGKRFAQKNSLMIHQRVHSDEKPFACRECGKSFRHESNLSQHSRTHSDARPFECDVCQMGFRFKHHLQQHAATHETKQKPKAIVWSVLKEDRGLNIAQLHNGFRVK